MMSNDWTAGYASDMPYTTQYRLEVEYAGLFPNRLDLQMLGANIWSRCWARWMRHT